jgi:hypothetical protein
VSATAGLVLTMPAVCLVYTHKRTFRRGHQAPTASETHFFMWLFFAAPASFFAFVSASQADLASRSHLVMKLLRAAPASFFSVADALHVVP